MAEAIQDVTEQSAGGEGGYVCFSNVHSVVTSRHDELLRTITNESFMSMPDGKPIATVSHWIGVNGVSQVAGPDFMPEFMKKTPGARHYLYGATPETLSALSGALVNAIPDLNIVGTFSPPFRQLTEQEEVVIIRDIKKTNPDYIWVGLGAPKQEYWMAQHWHDLRPAILFGVGAAFDFHAGVKRRAPEWMRSAGLEWLHRLASEPGRLWKRYLVTNSIFLYSIGKFILRRRMAGGIESQ